jgi:glycosyltransferase involved in cell wall biosynthesis
MRGLSIIVEMENARQVSWDDVRETIEALAREVADFSQANPGFGPEIIFVQAGERDDTALLEKSVRDAGALDGLARLLFASIPNGRYYEVKAEGLRLSHGDPVIFLDSDVRPENGWLRTLVAPFKNPGTIAVNGHTFLECSDFMSRTYALMWMFPLRDGDDRFATKRALNFNNCAFRRDWIVESGIPMDNGFKVSCTLLQNKLRQDGHTLVNAPAMVAHPPLRGARFFIWRALVTGRDTDRKYELLKSARISKRLAHAGSRWFTTIWRTVRRIVGGASKVGMPAWQVPAALALGVSFYTLAALGQFVRATGLTSDRKEFVPAYVEHS